MGLMMSVFKEGVHRVEQMCGQSADLVEPAPGSFKVA